MSTCHSCDTTLGPDNFLPDVCTDCFPDCRCLSCTELRQQMAEDWHAEMAFEASRGN